MNTTLTIRLLIVSVLGLVASCLINKSLKAELDAANVASAQYRTQAESMSQQIEQLQADVQRERSIAHSRQSRIREIERRYQQLKLEAVKVVENEPESKAWAADTVPESVIGMLNNGVSHGD